MKRGVVIVAGGAGQRMGSELPKQYMELDNKPVIVHTLERFYQFDPKIKVVLVLAEGHGKFWDKITNSYEHVSGVEVAPGGKTRFESVKNGLQIIEDDLIVGIHDAVRPLVSQGTLRRCYETAKKKGSAIPVTEMEETVRMVRNQDPSVHLDRSLLRRVQTPQVFQSEMIRKAYRQSFVPAFTDDASVFESLYKKVTLVEGNRENIKITTPADLQLASLFIRSVE